MTRIYLYAFSSAGDEIGQISTPGGVIMPLCRSEQINQDDGYQKQNEGLFLDFSFPIQVYQSFPAKTSF